MARVFGWVLKAIGALAVLVFVLGGIIGYGRRAKEQAAIEAGATASVGRPPPAPPPAIEQYAASVATFEKNQLDECITIEVTPKPGQAEASRKLIGELGAPKPGADEVQRLTKSCDEQFQGRAVLGTCLVDNPAVKLGHVKIQSRYYNYATMGEDDSHMKDCLNGHGDWKAPDASTLEHARLQFRMRQLDKLAKTSN